MLWAVAPSEHGDHVRAIEQPIEQALGHDRRGEQLKEILGFANQEAESFGVFEIAQPAHRLGSSQTTLWSQSCRAGSTKPSEIQASMITACKLRA